VTVACVPSAGHRPHLRGYQPNKMLLYHSWVGLPLYLAAVCPLQFGESSVIVAFEKLQLGQIVAAKQTNPFDLVIETQFLIDEPTMKLLCEILIFVWFRPNSSWFTAWTPMVRFFSDWTSWEKNPPIWPSTKFYPSHAFAMSGGSAGSTRSTLLAAWAAGQCHLQGTIGDPQSPPMKGQGRQGLLIDPELTLKVAESCVFLRFFQLFRTSFSSHVTMCVVWNLSGSFYQIDLSRTPSGWMASPLPTPQSVQNLHWLVVSTPPKNISQLGWLFPIYGKIKKCSKPPTSICSIHSTRTSPEISPTCFYIPQNRPTKKCVQTSRGW